ncbi:MAG TPA: DsbA family protein [Solirubrobacteraceae bacterium]
MAEPVFFYDFSSPYSYFAAHRIDDALPVPPRWQPILFGGLIREIGKLAWSMRPGSGRDAQMRECEEQAAGLGLPLRWPRGWPTETYSVVVLRAALVAAELGLVREFSLAAYRQGFGLGRDLTDIHVVLEAADEAGADRAAVREGVERADVKERLRRVTDDARRLGVTGIPTVCVEGTLYWGNDRLEDAAAALTGSVPP